MKRLRTGRTAARPFGCSTNLGSLQALQILNVYTFQEVLKGKNNGGEGGIQPNECGALDHLAWPCSDTGNKALIGNPTLPRCNRHVLKANSHGECSTAMENVARACSSVTFQFS